MRRTFGIIVSVALLALGIAPVSTVAQTTAAPAVQAIADCTGELQTQPSTMVLACADANLAAQQLKWIGWGEATAVATGIERYNDCTPSCVAGRFHERPIAIVASGTQQCQGGQVAYDEITVVGDTTAGQPNNPRPCKP